MSTTTFQKIATALAGAVLAASASPAFAAWTFTGNTNVSSDAGVKATATAYSVLNETTTTTTAGVTTAAGAFKTSTAFVGSSLSYNTPTSGLGVHAAGVTESGNGHAVDNVGYTDMVLFSFAYDVVGGAAAKVDLTGFKMGWANGDSDVSLLYYSGTSAPGAIVGQSWTQLYASGWRLLSNYDSVGTTAQTETRNVTSSWWMISAYSTSFGTAPTANTVTSGLNLGGDYFKIASLNGAVIAPTVQVPEPGSLALVGLAMVGLVGARRRAARRS